MPPKQPTKAAKRNDSQAVIDVQRTDDPIPTCKITKLNKDAQFMIRMIT